jgi:ATP-dependent Clp protease ATP-binding subunit ClpC
VARPVAGVDGTVDEEVIAEVVSKMTGVPLQRSRRTRPSACSSSRTELHKKVISQDEAIKAIAKAIRRARAGLKDPKRPMGSFIFVGPSGVGKTLLSKALAEFMFGDEDALVHLDMSEYMEKHNVSRLVGAPPGYVGYEEGGQLTEQIRRRPYSVVLLDEVEKAHPDVFNMLLQIMEEGRLTDSFGRHVDFRNTILIMTSNIGADLIKGGGGFGFQKRTEAVDYDNIKTVLMKEIERFFRPEFINRLDDIIVFRPLNQSRPHQIIEYEVGKLAKRLSQQGITSSSTSRQGLPHRTRLQPRLRRSPPPQRHRTVRRGPSLRDAPLRRPPQQERRPSGESRMPPSFHRFTPNDRPISDDDGPPDPPRRAAQGPKEPGRCRS